MPRQDIAQTQENGGVSQTTVLEISPSLYTIPTKFGSSTSINIATLFSNNTIKVYLVTKQGSTIISREAVTDITLSKDTLTITDALACSGEMDNRIRVTATYGNYTEFLDLVCDFIKVTSVDLTVVDNGSYILTGGETFEVSTSDFSVTKAVINFNDGTTVADNNPYWDGILYKNNPPTNITDVINGVGTIPQSDNAKVFIKYDYTNPFVSNQNGSYYYEHDLVVTPNEIQSYRFTSQPTSVRKGNKLGDYKSSFVLVGTDADNEDHVINSSLYSFKNDTYILSGSLISSITIIVNENGTDVEKTINLSTDILIINAVISNYEISDVIKSSYETDEMFDFTDLTFTIEYEGTDYKDTLTFFGSNNGFVVFFGELNTASSFNGTSTLSALGITTADSGNTMTFSLRPDIADTYASKTVSINIIEIDNIVSIEITNAFRDYEIGDRFLKQGDTTKAVIKYLDGNNELKQKIVPLNSGYNKLIVEPAKDELLSQIEPNKAVRVSSAFDSKVNTNYLISVGARTVSEDAFTLNCHVELRNSIELPNGKTITSSNGYLAVIDQNDNLVGYIDNINDPDKEAKVVLFDDYAPVIDGSANIEVMFPSYQEGLADDINKCHFGVLFGANNAKNRLFLSGNKEKGNADWHSSEANYTDYETEIIPLNGNFSYFSDESIMYYGETDNDVVGYEVVSNDKLLVLKNKSDKEKTVYFRNPTVVKAIDAAGGEMADLDGSATYQEEFALTKGNNSVAGISPKSIVNFNGETLFLDSNKQLVGLDVAGIVGDNQRYANTRSQYIDKMLANFDLEDAIVWTDNTYLFISIKDYGILATHFRTVNSDTKQYEWFYLTSMNPTSFLDIDGKLFFGNDKGQLFEVKKGQYVDTTKLFSSQTLRYFNGKLVIERSVVEEIKDREDEDFTFKTLIPENADYKEKVFFKIAVMKSDNTADIKIDNTNHWIEVLNSDLVLTEDTVYYLDGYETVEPNASEADLVGVIGVKFKLKQVSVDGLEHGDRFELYKIVNNQEVKIDIVAFNSATLCCCLEDETIEVSKYHLATDSNDYNTITLAKDGKDIELVRYGSQSDTHNFVSEIRSRKNVEAFYITAPFVLGGLDLLKTVHSYTLTNDVGIPSQIEIAYASNKIPLVDMKKMSYISLTREQLGFDLNDLNFHKVDFDKTVVPRTYTVNRILTYQKFVCFAFKNYDDTNAVLSAMSVTYSTPYPSYSGD